MKKLLYISAASAALFFSACAGNPQNDHGGDSVEMSADSMSADTIINPTDTTSTGIDNSASGGIGDMQTDSAK